MIHETTAIGALISTNVMVDVLTSEKKHDNYCRIIVNNLMNYSSGSKGAGGTSPLGQNSFIFMQFSV